MEFEEFKEEEEKPKKRRTRKKVEKKLVRMVYKAQRRDSYIDIPEEQVKAHEEAGWEKC